VPNVVIHRFDDPRMVPTRPPFRDIPAKRGSVDLPPAHTLAWATVQALRQLGDSGKVEEINETVVELACLTE
jgi:hypothetical protein